jgi:hypothetical protein
MLRTPAEGIDKDDARSQLGRHAGLKHRLGHFLARAIGQVGLA